MQYEVEINGRSRRVLVTRAGDGFAVAVDGRTRRVDATRIDAQTLSFVHREVWPNGDSRGGSRTVSTVTIVPDSALGQWTVWVGSTSFAVTVNGRRRRRDPGGHAGTGPHRIVAPMPGKVVRILVQPGQTVKTRQPLIVVEAMKMENELRAGGNGTVAGIHVQEGASVDAGALLVVIE